MASLRAQVQKELLLAEALAGRFGVGSLAVRLAAEESYARRLAALGEQFQDAALLAMAAESLTHVTPWDYYEVLLWDAFGWSANKHVLQMLQWTATLSRQGLMAAAALLSLVQAQLVSSAADSLCIGS